MTKEKILLVDDEPDILSILEPLLTAEGFQVRKASGGKEALDMCQAEPADLVMTELVRSNEHLQQKIIERKRTEQALRQAKEAALEAQRRVQRLADDFEYGKILKYL